MLKLKKGFTRTPTLASLLCVLIKYYNILKKMVKSFFSSFFPKSNKNTMSKLAFGFTLVEMMVSISIITIITLVVLFDYKNFNDNLSLSAAQQEISIAIRQAQIYGISVKESAGSSCGSNFCSGYGIYFNPNDPTSYYLFVDKNNNGMYDNDGTGICANNSECVEKGTLRSGVKINNICGVPFGGSACPLVAVSGFKSINITFIRPNPAAVIRFVKSDNSLTNSYQTGQIIFTSLLSKTSKITIENTGQISVQ